MYGNMENGLKVWLNNGYWKSKKNTLIYHFWFLNSFLVICTQQKRFGINVIFFSKGQTFFSLSTYLYVVGYLWTLKCSISISMLQAPSSNLHTFPPSWFSTSSIISSSYKSLVVFVNCFKIASLVLPSFHLHIQFLVCKNYSFQLAYQTFL